MPDTIEQPPAAPHQESSEQLFNRIMAAEQPQQQQQAEPAPSKTEPVREAPKPEAKADDIPAQFIAGQKEEPKPEDEYDKLLEEKPQGQIKHEHYERLKAATKKKVDAVSAELAAARTELEAARSRGVPEEIAAELKNYKEALAEKESLLERVAVQESPKFKERYTAKEAAIAERLKRYGTEMAMDVEKLDQALRSSPKRRIELLDEMNVEGAALSSISGLMSQYDLLQDDKTQFLSQSKEEHARWQKEQQESMTRQEQERVANEDRVFNAALDQMSKTFAPFQEVEGNAAWNTQARALREEAKKYFNGQVPLENLAEAVIRGVGSPVQDKIMERQQKRISELETEIASLKTAQPGANGYVPSPDGTGDLSKMGPDERAKYVFNQFKASNQGF